MTLSLVYSEVATRLGCKQAPIRSCRRDLIHRSQRPRPKAPISVMADSVLGGFRNDGRVGQGLGTTAMLRYVQGVCDGMRG